MAVEQLSPSGQHHRNGSGRSDARQEWV